MRTVIPNTGWPYTYRAHIIRYDGWFRKGWKFVIEQKWVHWDHYTRSFKVYKTKEEAEIAANHYLDEIEGNNDKEFVDL